MGIDIVYFIKTHDLQKYGISVKTTILHALKITGRRKRKYLQKGGWINPFG